MTLGRIAADDDDHRTDTTAAMLHATTDAQVWAREWVRIAREIEAADDGREVIDEGWMIGWFANAIEIGRAAGRADVVGWKPDA